MIVAPSPKPRRYSADWWWDVGLKSMVPLAAAVAGVLIAHENSLHDHHARISALEKEANKISVMSERILETLTQIQVSIGRLDERVAAIGKK